MPEGNMILIGEYIFTFPEPARYECFYYTEWNQENTYMWNTAGKHILSPLERCLRHLKTTSTTAVAIVTVACKWCVPSASDVFLSKNDNSGEETREASEMVEYDFYFTEYDFCPVLISTHCTIILIYLW
jgi:hypothetical protein